MYIENRSNNTKHRWIIFKKSFDSNKPVTCITSMQQIQSITQALGDLDGCQGCGEY